jgi:hypothetical protein
MGMIGRESEVRAVRGLLRRHRVVGLVGARQVGKTTLADMVARGWDREVTCFDLDNPEDLARIEDPMLALKDLRGLVVIDEVHRVPKLFEVLRVLVDRPRKPARFLILGSASPELLKQGSETLAGRIVYHELSGFCIGEVGSEKHLRLWLRGGLPRSYLARSLKESHEWRRGFIRTFLERDLPQLGVNINATTMRRFWTMLAHYHGQTWNASEFGRSFGVADTTVRGYLDRLACSLVVHVLQPWHANIAKRQVRAPKVYIADSGLLHTLLNLRSKADLESHPKLGASWEGFVIEQIRRRLGAERDECFFWSTHAGAELDLMVVRGRTRAGFEIKRTSSPRVTPSMRHALRDLGLQRLTVVHAGDKSFPLAERIQAMPLVQLLSDLKPLA